MSDDDRSPGLPSAPDDAADGAAPPPARRRGWRIAGWALGLLLLALAAVPAALWWALGTSSGTAWLLGQVPGLTVTAPQGGLMGEFSAERLDLVWPGAADGDHLRIDGPRWQGLALSRAVAAQARVRLDVDRLQATRVELRLTSDPDAPRLAPPATLRLPVELGLQRVEIGEFHTTALGDRPLRGVRGTVRLGTDGGLTHRVDDLALTWDRIELKGSASIGSESPFALDARLAMASVASTAETEPQVAIDATVTARGPLERLAVQATLRGTLPRGRSGAEAPALDLTATVRPFAAWPLGALQAQTRALDLAALDSSAPRTALSGSADLVSDGSDRPADATIRLENALPGRVDEGRLPVRSLRTEVRARPDDPRRIEIRTLELVLGSAREAGGSVRGSGAWAPERATFSATLSDLLPSALDARAPAMRLSGSVELDAATPAGQPPAVTVRGRIAGNLPRQGKPERMQLELDATATADRIELRRAQLQGAGSRATLAGRALRQGRGWQLAGQGTLVDFDPSLWWPGAEGSGWRKGPHRLNGRLDLDGLLPSAPGAAPPLLQRIATAQGKATLTVSDSLLAGLPLAGTLALQGDGRTGMAVDAALKLADGSAVARGRLDAGRRDHWELDLHAPDLAPWATLARLGLPAAKAPPALAGRLDGELRLDGRWPDLATTGQVTLKDARAGTLQLARGALRWKASTAAQAPLEVLAEIDQLGADPQKLDSLRLSVTGTAADHLVQLDAASPVRPPRWIDLLHGADAAAGSAAPPSTGTVAELRVQGALQWDTAWQQPLRWHGRVQKTEARRRGGSLPAPWFRLGATEVDAQYDPPTGTPKVVVGPGRAELPNLALRWTQLRWQGGSAPLVDVQAEFEPFAVAPLLKRLQPDFGWGGDLVLAGRVNVRSAPSFVAEIEFGRERGDLAVTDEAGTQPLELTDLRLALNARDGVWHFTQALAGKTLGALAGAATVRTDPKLFWPPAEAPLEGVFEGRVADLAAWGAWAPAGWRIRGAVHASASLGGRFGAPLYTGQIDGSGLGVRNLVEGVDVRDGELQVTLEGETARIVKLQARSGEGSVQVTGGAVFGDTPQATLNLVAERLLVLGRVDRRIVASGQATLKLQPRSMQLDGRFTIDQGLFDFSRGNAPSLGDDVVVLREPSATEAELVAQRTGAARDVRMNVVLNLGQALRLRGRGLDTLLRGEVLITAPEGRLAVNGTVNAVQGTYAAYGQRLVIERGAVTFNGTIANPRLDILAVRPNIDIVAGVSITGTASTPRIALYSEPDLPDNEKLSWLVLGRAPEGLPGSDTALLQAAAMALLAGDGDRPRSELAELLQFDNLSVRQTDGEVRNTVLTVGKQLSQRWYIGYERSLNATAGNWQLIYRLAQRFTVRLQTGLDNSIDLIWSWRWD